MDFVKTFGNSVTGWFSQDSTAQVKRICIIGGGPSGLAALKVIAETEQYKHRLWKPSAFEERDSIGGIWVPAPPIGDPPLTPLYDSLTTNLPHPVMAYESFSFPPSTPVFPKAVVVQKYLEDYAAHFDLNKHVHFNSKIEKMAWDASTAKWNVAISNRPSPEEFDFVIVANGHYRVPRYPETPGLSKWLEAKKASHSVYYRRPNDLGDVILVVGGGPSGRDISAEMRTVAKTVFHSVADPIPPPKDDDGTYKQKGRVVEFKDDGSVLFADGTVESGIDYCILATGYEFAYPFITPLAESIPPPIPPLPDRLYNTTFSVFPLAKQLFPLQADYPASSCAHLGLIQRAAPLPLVEAQMRAIVKVIAHPESLDSTRETADILARYDKLKAELGDNEAAILKSWHRFEEQEQFDYRDELHAFVDPGTDRKVPDWVREMYVERDVLREEWRYMESTGEAEDFVKGVGEKSPEEWVDLLRKLLHRAKGRRGREHGSEP